MSGNARSRSRWGAWFFLLLAVGLLVLATVSAVAAYEFWYDGRVYEGVRVAGIPLGGLSFDQAIEVIRDGLTPYPGAPVIVRYGDRTWSLPSADLGIAVDARVTAGQAFNIGRHGSLGFERSLAVMWQGLRDDLMAQWLALSEGITVTPTLHFDENRLAFSLKRIAQEVDLPPREGSLSVSGLEVTGTPGQAGRLVNLDQTRAAVVPLLQAGQGGVVDLAVEERLPAVMSVDNATARASALLHTSLNLVVAGLDGPQRYAVDPATLRQWLSFLPTPDSDGTMELVVELNPEPITTFVQQIARQLDRPAYDARLDFNVETNQVVVLQPSQPGQQLDVAASAASIEAAIMDGAGQPQASAAAEPPAASKTVTLSLAVLQPKVDSNKVAEMGIVEQISEGTTYFAGSTRERVQNIVTAADKLRGAVVPPGEEFSFYHFVGDVTAANGFVDSLIIRGDRTEVGVGGGVCQVSTTVFRAAFWAGFPILERYPHGYVVGWYGEPGLDASIFTPDADFRFRNDTAHFLVIQPEVDTPKGASRFTSTAPGQTALWRWRSRLSQTCATRPNRSTRKTSRCPPASSNR